MKPFLRWILIGLGGLAVLVACFYAEEDWRGWHAWNTFKHKWEAKGEQFDLASVVPPKVPDDQNFAMSPVWIAEIKLLWQDTPKRAEAWYGHRIDDAEVSRIVPRLPVSVSGLTGNNWASRKALATPEPSGSWATGQAINLVAWQAYYRDLERTVPGADIPVTPQPQSPAADVLLALSKFDPVIEKLRQDSALPDSRFPVIYATDNPAEILLPHLAVVKRYAQVLQLRAVAELQTGRPDEALDDVKLMLRLADSIHTEPFIISHLVRIAIVNLTLQPVWEGLAAHQWSDAQLAELNSALAKLDFLADYRLTLRGEMVFQGAIINYVRRHLDQFSNVLGNGGSHRRAPLSKRIGWHLIPSGWYYQQRLYCARPMVELFIPLVDTNNGTVSPAAARRADAAVRVETRHANPYNTMEKLLLPALGNMVRRFAYGQESVDLARVTMALERYRLAHGEYPGMLDVLEPRFIEKLPHDIINGQPLQYRLTFGGKFLLYSVGWNEKDDDGQVVRGRNGAVDTSSGDWVWKN